MANHRSFRLPAPAPAAAITVAALAALVLLVGACTEMQPPVGELSDLGVVEGRITEAGEPVAARIRFESMYGEAMSTTVVAAADTTGWYRAELPLGRFQYRVYFESDGYGNLIADTLKVGRTVYRRDIALGRAMVAVTLPDSADVSSAELRLTAVVEGVDGVSLWNISRYDSGACVDGTIVFDLRLLPAVVYAMEIDCNNGAQDARIPAPGDGSSPDSLHVGLQAVTRFDYDFRPYAVMLSGTVTGCPGQRPSRYELAAVDAAGRTVSRARCSADERFRLTLLNAQPVRVSCDYEQVMQWYGGSNAADATVIDLPPGGLANGIAFIGGGLRIAFDGPGYRLDNSADVVLVDDSGSSVEVSNYDGNPLTIFNLRPGDWRLYVPGSCNHEPWQPLWWEGAAEEDLATPITIEAGQLHDVTVELLDGGTIRGTFVHTGDVRLWSIALAVHRLDGGALCPARSQYGSDTFEFVGVPAGDFLLALHMGALTWWYPGSWAQADAAPVTVTDGGAVSDLTWTLPFPYKRATP